MKKLSEYECKVGVEVKGEYLDRARAALEELRACEVPLFVTQLAGGPEAGPLFPIYGPGASGPERGVFFLLCDLSEGEPGHESCVVCGHPRPVPQPDIRTEPIEQVRAELAAEGIDTATLVAGIRERLAKMKDGERPKGGADGQ